jgi:superfamily II DNA or RNA helicase
MVSIELNNNKFKLTGNRKVLDKIYKDMAVKHPGQFYLRPHMKKGWDGCIHYLTEYGYAQTGFLNRVTSLIEKYKEEYTFVDNRKLLETKKIPTKINDFIARPYQIEAVESIVNNMVGDIPYQRGVIGAATNAGKTLIAAMIHLSFKNAKSIILINNSPLFQQFLDDMPKLFGDNWGYMQGKNLRWGNVMVCMTPTLRLNMSKYASILSTYNILLFDECHLITSKTNKHIVTHLINTIVRVGLSGSPFNHKDPTKNMDVEAFFGAQTFTITNLEMQKLGFSSEIVVKIIMGNTKVHIKGDYNEEYRLGIMESIEREQMLLKRVRFYFKRKQYPLLIICKYHYHVERVYEVVKEIYGSELNVDYLHHKVKDKKQRLDKFKEGKTQILVASLLIKLGQNMPLMRCLINAAGGDSHINAKQLLGRATRTHESKKKVYFEDFADLGAYLRRHSKHRYKFYKAEGFKVILHNDEVRKILGIARKK